MATVGSVPSGLTSRPGFWRVLVPVGIIAGVVVGAMVFRGNEPSNAYQFQNDPATSGVTPASTSPNTSAFNKTEPVYSNSTYSNKSGFNSPSTVPSSGFNQNGMGGNTTLFPATNPNTSSPTLPNNGVNPLPTGSNPPSTFANSPGVNPPNPAWPAAPDPVVPTTSGTGTTAGDSKQQKIQSLEKELERPSTVYQVGKKQNDAASTVKPPKITPGVRLAGMFPQSFLAVPGTPVFAVLAQGIPGSATFGTGSKLIGTVTAFQSGRLFVDFQQMINPAGEQVAISAFLVDFRDGNPGLMVEGNKNSQWPKIIEKYTSQLLPSLLSKNTTIINQNGGAQPAQTPPQKPVTISGGNILVQFVGAGNNANPTSTGNQGVMNPNGLGNTTPTSPNAPGTPQGTNPNPPPSTNQANPGGNGIR